MKFLDGDERTRLIRGETERTGSVLDQITDPVQLTHNLMNTQGRQQRRYYKYMRLSEVDTACSREWVIGHLNDVWRPDNVHFASLCMMDMGTALHHWLQNYSPFLLDKLLGYWRCMACGNRRRFGHRPTEPCEFCGASHRATQYDEYMFRLENPFRVVGKMDAILRIDGKYRIGEIKSFAGTPQKSNVPMGAHVSQLSGYMYFSQFDEPDALPVEIDREVGYLIYVSKQFNYREPIKTVPVRPTEKSLAPIIKKVGDFTEGVKNRTLPEALPKCIQSDFFGAPAKSCAMVERCKAYYNEGVENV